MTVASPVATTLRIPCEPTEKYFLSGKINIYTNANDIKCRKNVSTTLKALNFLKKCKRRDFLIKKWKKTIEFCFDLTYT
jgi:hypothetical protein